MEPPFLAIELRKLLLWLTLECFRRKFVRKRINWTGRAGSLSQKNDRKKGVVLPQSGRGFSKFARKSVYYNPPFRNPGSATVYAVKLTKAREILISPRMWLGQYEYCPAPLPCHRSYVQSNVYVCTNRLDGYYECFWLCCLAI